MRILIAEDDQVLADGLLRTLRASGAAVDHVANGNEADAALMTSHEFDLIILDPPKYAPSRSALTKASRAYKDLNRMAMLLLNEGGLLATFSCSGAVDISMFKQIIAWAALDAGKNVQFIQQFSQAADHPIRSSFPEGEYLKGLLCRVIST
jgi:23S rRNA (cytosine1962-C5)-methyltransferase